MSWGTVGKEVKTERNSHGGLVVQRWGIVWTTGKALALP